MENAAQWKLALAMLARMMCASGHRSMLCPCHVCHVEVSENRGYLIGVVLRWESYYLGVYYRGP